MATLASVESLLGSMAFAVALGLTGLIGGFLYCRKSK